MTHAETLTKLAGLQQMVQPATPKFELLDKLAAHLQTVEPQDFNLDSVRYGPCGCAMGHTPEAGIGVSMARFVCEAVTGTLLRKYVDREKMAEGEWVELRFVVGERVLPIFAAAMHIFDLGEQEADMLFGGIHAYEEDEYPDMQSLGSVSKGKAHWKCWCARYNNLRAAYGLPAANLEF